MGLSCGIVGLPNVGKSTLFNCLSNARAQVANFPFCTIEPNQGMITVPDERVNKLAELVKPKEVIPATMEIFDIAGLVKNASKGEGLGNKFLMHIRNTDAIIHVLRCFDDPNITHVDGTVNPLRDKEIIDYELLLKDLETIENRLGKIVKTAQAGSKEARKEMEIIERYREHLKAGKPARTMPIDPREKELIKEVHLLTSKPVLYVCNVDEASVKTGNAWVESVKKVIEEEQAEMLLIAARMEAEIAEFEDPEEKKIFLEEMGMKEPGVNRLIRAAYKLLNLETFLTAGEKAVRAWTIRKGTLAPQAAGVIHSDFEKAFIRAEVIKYEDYIRYGSEAACREAGKISIEGKDYVVQDGDVIYFRVGV